MGKGGRQGGLDGVPNRILIPGQQGKDPAQAQAAHKGKERHQIQNKAHKALCAAGELVIQEQDAEIQQIQQRYHDTLSHIGEKPMEIGFEDRDVSKSDMVLENVDEVGHKQFKGSRDELIAWNVWRSNLQNQIMMESSIEAPVGTLITFSFNVSAQGNITNLKYSCSNKKYAKEARADMVRVLQNLRYTEILKFPSNTKRTNVKFKGAFLLDYSTSFSKPSDYSDYERVRY